VRVQFEDNSKSVAGSEGDQLGNKVRL